MEEPISFSNWLMRIEAVFCLGAHGVASFEGHTTVRSVCDSQELVEAMEEQGSRNCGKIVGKVFEVHFLLLLHVG